MIQGSGVGAAGWGPQVDALRSSFTCLCFDNRGYGESQPVGGRLTVERMAEDALALMDAQGWTDAHVVGHSLGGLVALFLAHAAPARVRSLALLCTFASGAVPTRLTPWLIGAGLRTRLGTRRSRRDAFLQMILSPSELARVDRDALARHLGELFGRPLERQPRIVMDQLRAMRNADATPFLHALDSIPSLVVSAEHDRIAPPSAGHALAAAIPGARYVEITGTAHACTILEADRINALLLEHLASVEPPRSIPVP